ncbi:MAG: FxLYD domain-containing protein [Dehalococcoidia bacterium]|nr:FxLYD domain-containing protein [Dehalococcoidia bacterium]
MRKLFVGLLAIVGLLAAGCIIQFATLYKDDAGRTHFVGLASNLTNADVVDAVVEVRFYDSSNNLLDTRFVNPCTRTLQDHQSSPVESILPPGVTASRTENIVHPLTFGTKLAPDMDVSDVKLQVDGDTTHLTGKVENDDSKTFYAVQVCAAFYDDDGDVVRVGRVFLDPAKLSRGATGTFDIAIEDMPSDVEEYQLWVDATVRNPTDVTAPVVVGPKNLPGAEATATPTATPEPTATPG